MNAITTSVARRAKAERKQAALAPIQDALDEAIATARDVLHHDDPNLRLRAAHAISQISASYVRIYEAVELESRLDELESRLQPPGHHN